MTETAWTYSLDGWDFDGGIYTSRDDAIEAAMEDAKLGGEEVAHIAEIEFFDPCLINADAILDRLRDAAYESGYSDYSDAWLSDVTTAQVMTLEWSLNDALYQWLSETHNLPRFFMVRDSEAVEVYDDRRR